MNTERKWCGRWINTGMIMVSAIDAPAPAYYFRKTFDCTEEINEAVIYLCGLGLHELYVNGQKADDRVLAPVATQYDQHAGYICYDVSKLLVKGKNAVVVLLGNGLFNSWYWSSCISIGKQTNKNPQSKTHTLLQN